MFQHCNKFPLRFNRIYLAFPLGPVTSLAFYFLSINFYRVSSASALDPTMLPSRCCFLPEFYPPSPVLDNSILLQGYKSHPWNSPVLSVPFPKVWHLEEPCNWPVFSPCLKSGYLSPQFGVFSCLPWNKRLKDIYLDGPIIEYNQWLSHGRHGINIRAMNRKSPTCDFQVLGLSLTY